ncbi:hypothetical protein BDK51DRAFT_51912 [Blyttiomyces helicus]|uniref:Uncharacterized protein n=1 Tax=Blyttiomyces helicus TaxID=388810 RepID=A0A4P9W447_9FUNG|nr:hypothetical protein BDK51DRAFT_51912 [Blyttiomyces helicus]|eukprot:RKO84936.1 hypothetical protein BDK51DRAFT_51912 [Blyttiomyces helicus]
MTAASGERFDQIARQPSHRNAPSMATPHHHVPLSPSLQSLRVRDDSNSNVMPSNICVLTGRVYKDPESYVFLTCDCNGKDTCDAHTTPTRDDSIARGPGLLIRDGGKPILTPLRRRWTSAGAARVTSQHPATENTGSRSRPPNVDLTFRTFKHSTSKPLKTMDDIPSTKICTSLDGNATLFNCHSGAAALCRSQAARNSRVGALEGGSLINAITAPELKQSNTSMDPRHLTQPHPKSAPRAQPCPPPPPAHVYPSHPVGTPRAPPTFDYIRPVLQSTLLLLLFATTVFVTFQTVVLYRLLPLLDAHITAMEVRVLVSAAGSAGVGAAGLGFSFFGWPGCFSAPAVQPRLYQDVVESHRYRLSEFDLRFSAAANTSGWGFGSMEREAMGDVIITTILSSTGLPSPRELDVRLSVRRMLV